MVAISVRCCCRFCGTSQRKWHHTLWWDCRGAWCFKVSLETFPINSAGYLRLEFFRF